MAEKTDEEKGKKLGEKTDELLLSLFNALSDYEDAKKTEDEHAMDDFEMYLIDQAIANAYKDATNQGAFNTILYTKYHFKENKQKYLDRVDENIKDKEKEAKRLFKEEKYPNIVKDEAFKTMEDQIKRIPDPQAGRDGFDRWHKDICCNLMNAYKENDLDKAFKYGNTQKWVNMAVKYLYVFASLLKRMNEFSGKSRLFQNVIEQGNNLHVPIDSYILKAVFNNEMRKDLLDNKWFVAEHPEDYNYANVDGRLCPKKDKEGHNTKSFESCFNSYKKQCDEIPISHYTFTWSKITSYEDYRLIQEKIKEIIPEEMSPLEWENKVWLQMAMKG